ncbi:cytochrome P450 [Armillaria luteobubalina]|uniref:Cytochrome P450 n=1 Tax=Armillaria luteobubalina TaxID=153913 RepID=A0AA39P6S0_9AGAR|nr:cytochrome P450 [Armillaria luteobubalina]
MGNSLTTLAIAVALVSLALASRMLFTTCVSATFPPGPKGLPFIGNIFDMPSEKEWHTFTRWGEKYGKITSPLFSYSHTYVISFLSRRPYLGFGPWTTHGSDKHCPDGYQHAGQESAIYSDRPIMALGGELIGWKFSFVLMRYGSHFRDSRRRVHQIFGTNAAFKQFLLIVELEAHRFLKRISTKPEDFLQEIQRMNVANIMQISYGYEIQEKNDPFAGLANEAAHHFALSTTPGTFLVNIIPILRHIPDWFPGAGFKRTAKEWRSTLQELMEQPYNYAKQQIAAEHARYSFTSSQLEDGISSDKEFDIKWSAATMYTVASIYAFFKAMLLYPDIQAKAQAEIDAVVGNDRLPRFDDRDHLPYINALALEVIRWHTVEPLGLPHSVTEDDVQSGYLIPKGSVVIANIWNMLHDPAVYDKPFEFMPERFIRMDGKEPQMNPHKMAFGFGRRICPGKLLADASMFISCAMVLAVLNISQYYENEVLSETNTEHTAGTVRQDSFLTSKDHY